MARQPIRPKKKQNTPQYHCKDCVHSYDWHSKALDGHLILCRCPHDEKSQHGKFCKFLSDPQCDKFVKRTEPNAEAN